MPFPVRFVIFVKNDPEMKPLKKLFLCAALLTVVWDGAAQFTAAPRKYVDIVLTPDRADWNYRTGEPATVKVQALRNGVPMETEIAYECGPEMLPPDDRGTVGTKNGAAVIRLGTMREPGFRVCRVRVTCEGKEYADQVKVGYSPEAIRPTVKLPEDFTAFWEAAKAEAAKVPMDARLTLLPEYSTPTVDVYLVNLQNYKKGQRMYGYLCKPKAPGKYPVLMSPPGAGVKPQRPSTAYADRGFISLSIEIHGIDPRLDAGTYADLSRAFGSYMYYDLDNRDRYYYKKVYLGCVRAIDFLCSLPEFDGKNVVVTGGSQGGALSIVTAALDPRVTCLAAFYPALCDMEGYLHGRAGGWPHLFAPANRGVTDTPEKIATAAYYDVVNFARNVKVPGFYSFGYNDNTCPPTSVFAAVNSVTAPKEVCVTPITGHWRFGESNEKSLRWIDAQIGR